MGKMLGKDADENERPVMKCSLCEYKNITMINIHVKEQIKHE